MSVKHWWHQHLPDGQGKFWIAYYYEFIITSDYISHDNDILMWLTMHAGPCKDYVNARMVGR